MSEQEIQQGIEDVLVLDEASRVIEIMLNGQTSATIRLADLPSKRDFASGLWAHDVIKEPPTVQVKREGQALSMDIGIESIGYNFRLDHSGLKSFGTRIDFSKVKGGFIPIVHGNPLRFVQEIVRFVVFAPRSLSQI